MEENCFHQQSKSLKIRHVGWQVGSPCSSSPQASYQSHSPKTTTRKVNNNMASKPAPGGALVSLNDYSCRVRAGRRAGGPSNHSIGAKCNDWMSSLQSSDSPAHCLIHSSMFGKRDLQQKKVSKILNLIIPWGLTHKMTSCHRGENNPTIASTFRQVRE